MAEVIKGSPKVDCLTGGYGQMVQFPDGTQNSICQSQRHLRICWQDDLLINVIGERIGVRQGVIKTG